MKQIKTSGYSLGTFFVFILFSCNNTGTTSEAKASDTTSTASSRDTSDMPAYNPAMDPLTVGAKFSKKLGDTLNMKVFEVTLKPGDSVAIHTHPDHSFYVIQGGKIEVTIQGMDKQIMDLKSGMGWIGGPTTDFGKNIGNTTVKWVETDVYRPRSK
jgi:hypothetical protein